MLRLQLAVADALSVGLVATPNASLLTPVYSEVEGASFAQVRCRWGLGSRSLV